MRNHYILLAVCPYYSSDKDHLLYCDGGRQRLSFPSEALKDEHCRRYCTKFKGYSDCMIAEFLTKGVEENEEQ